MAFPIAFIWLSLRNLCFMWVCGLYMAFDAGLRKVTDEVNGKLKDHRDSWGKRFDHYRNKPSSVGALEKHATERTGWGEQFNLRRYIYSQQIEYLWAAFLSTRSNDHSFSTKPQIKDIQGFLVG